MKLLATLLLAMAAAANVQAANQPYVVPIYRVTPEATTVTTEATTSATESTIDSTTETSSVATPLAGFMDKFSYILDGRQGRHPRALLLGNRPRGVPGYKFEHVCSGTLVDNSAIITTITCIESAMRDTFIKPCVGTAHDLTSNTDSDDKVLYEVEKHFAHPGYDSATNVNNIAVLKLATEVDLSLSNVGHITWALDIPAAETTCTTSYWDADVSTTNEQVSKEVIVKACNPVKDGAICSTYTPTPTECPYGANGASLVCDSKIAGLFTAHRNSDCSATLWQYEELSKDSMWIWESVNSAAPILNVSFATILVLITAMIKNL